MAKNLINDYPYTNMTYQNVDWLVEIVSKLVEKGKDNGEIKADDEVNAAYGQFINNYPYTNMTYQNIDWWINKVREIGAEQVKLIAQMETLQADVKNVVEKLGDKPDKLTTPEVVYATDNSTPPKTVGIRYTENAGEEGTIVMRDGIGSIAVPTAQDAQQAVPLEQMQAADNELNNKIEALDASTESALAGKVDKVTTGNKVYGTDNTGKQTTYSQASGQPTRYTLILRDANGCAKVADPVTDNDAATKKYVDSLPTGGGWTTVIDKTWTSDIKTANTIEFVDIPQSYVRPIQAMRIALWHDTPQVGAVYMDGVQLVLYAASENATTIDDYFPLANISDYFTSKDTTTATVDFVATQQDSLFIGGRWDDGTNISYGLARFKDANGNNVVPVPTDPAAILNTSKITNVDAAETAVNWTINAYLPNRTHKIYDYVDTPQTKTLTYATFNGKLDQKMTLPPDSSAAYTYILATAYEGATPATILPNMTKAQLDAFFSNASMNYVPDPYDITYTGSTYDELDSTLARYTANYSLSSGATFSITCYPVDTANTYGLKMYGRGNAGYVQISGTMQSTTRALQQVATITTNDYYNSDHTSNVVSQVITTDDTTNLPIGCFVCPRDTDNLIWVNQMEIEYSTTTPVSYKSFAEINVDVIDETFITKGTKRIDNNKYTSFNQKNILLKGSADDKRYNTIPNGYPAQIGFNVPYSTSAGTTETKIYAGSRLIVQIQY